MVLASLLRCLGAAPPEFGWPMGATKAYSQRLREAKGMGPLIMRPSQAVVQRCPCQNMASRSELSGKSLGCPED
jgi:hypothetical protein